MRKAMIVLILAICLAGLVQVACASQVTGPDNYGSMGNPIVTGSGGRSIGIASEITSDETAGNFVHIIGVNPSLFPKIFTYINVDTGTGNSGNLTRDMFTLYEDGVLQTITSFSYSTNDTTTRADIEFVFDDTGSMGDDIEAMKTNSNDEPIELLSISNTKITNQL